MNNIYNTQNSLEIEALSELKTHGYELDQLFHDGKIHRFGQKKSRWYICFQNNTRDGRSFLSGVCGDWRTDEKIKFHAGTKSWNTADRASVRRQYQKAKEESEKARLELHEETAVECQQKWNTLSESGNSPYLERKQLSELMGAKREGQILWIPCRDVYGKLWSLQQIDGSGEKRFYSNGRIHGCFHSIGNIDDATKLYIAEGFATAGSIHLATGGVVVAAFSAWNIGPVAEALRKKRRDMEIIICGDEDQWNEKNAGREAAQKAANFSKCSLVFPSFKNIGSKPTDFNDLHVLEGLDAVIDQLARCGNQSSTGSSETRVGIYRQDNGIIEHLKKNREGDLVPQRLCNFTAEIKKEITEDNGVERTVSFEICGKSEGGNPFTPIRTSAVEFPSMSWVLKEWGASAIVCAGQGAKDHLRAAIQNLSINIVKETVYTHTGWRKLNGEWVFLTSSGAIGSKGIDPGVRVELPSGNFSKYSLSEPPSNVGDIRASVFLSLSLLELGPDRITYPALAAIYRAPLNSIKKPDFSVFLCGPSGVFKTEVAAILQSHFGPEFNRLSLPENWSSTANALEKNSFTAKDVLFVVDDFAPGANRKDAESLHSKAERLLRAQGNQSGRGRLGSDCQSRAQFFPRGIIISTGEDVPLGHSLRARLAIIEIKKGDINPEELSKVQQASQSGAYAKAMAGYLKWLSPKIDELKNQASKTIQDMRQLFMEKLAESNSHQRIPEQLANLFWGLELFLQFSSDVGVIQKETTEVIRKKGIDAFVEMARNGHEYLVNADPVESFLRNFSAFIASGKGYFLDAATLGSPESSSSFGWRLENQQWVNKGIHLGWVSAHELWLIPEVCYSEILRHSPAAISLTENVLWKRLKERGYLLVSDCEDRNRCKRVIGGRRRDVIIFKDLAQIVGVAENGNTGTFGTIKNPTIPKNPLSWSGGGQ